MYKIVLSPRAQKELLKLERPIRQSVDRALLKLQENSFVTNFKFLKDKRLADFRIRVGNYRILYDIYKNDNVIYILRIGHRKDIYR
ncbi:MAG: hypothetical protein A3I89_03380 [Candidatus Harrisonbacteria bacterium RIFCSPLOWO2_02_FULL_41_11]|uniref:Addiction module toxin RelE n=1 Tax=Candidatus Harrisonbacteria bacterium RIFCSPHIGHO2_02_FULL_42_16 TaxID=1798404 RepID=A0A1G1ZI15_9BACT|nr:MAG: hypothetical protein A3B92_02980 [Candidatus Harrisonbacteria bacterium RIFCSPHIGHO2_02_FULL_42_16]OGY67226.1 MAG: hypothetical protein A3I89_03380 [Candidatus Harrisonbacteria bacterium RIFCSPLOWO2_02_FULL_41_11]